MGSAEKCLKNRGLWINAKKCLYEGAIVPTALYGAEAWGMRSAERRKVNVLEMICMRSLVGVSRIDRVRKEGVHRRAGIERELASKEDQRVLRRFGHVERMDEYRMARRVLMTDVSGGRVRGRQRFGWMDGMKMALGSKEEVEADGLGMTVTLRNNAQKIGRVKSPGAHVDDCVSRVYFFVLSDRPPASGGLSPGEWLGDAVV